MTVDPLIELDHLVRLYGERPAVRGISLSVPPGEIFGLLGPNGAGKSTTIKMLATLLLPSAGTARIAGYDLVAQANEVRKVIGYVPEGADLYDVLTGEEFLDLVRDLHKVPPEIAAKRRAPLAEALELRRDLDRPTGEYSKGMRQKLLVMAALQHDPKVLLLDEPLDGLDVQAQEVLKSLLREHVAQGGCVVYSSHILEVVERLCHRVAILHRGAVAAVGAPDELMAQSGEESLSRLFLKITSGGETAQ
ncbi:MAG TPA: ABC transporter ATP-binding protein [Thermoanaerobaculia bacterium]|nr:ABC transporter ATP-binding protein [Thermoanaerobaculia bacterium]